MGTGSLLCGGKTSTAWSWSLTLVKNVWSCTCTPTYTLMVLKGTTLLLVFSLYVLRGSKTSDDAFRLSHSIAFDCSIRPFLDLFHSRLYIFHLSRFSGDGLVSFPSFRFPVNHNFWYSDFHFASCKQILLTWSILISPLYMNSTRAFMSVNFTSFRITMGLFSSYCEKIASKYVLHADNTTCKMTRAEL